MFGKNPRKIIQKLLPIRVQAWMDSERAQGREFGTVRKVSATEAEAMLRHEIDLGEAKIVDFPITVHVQCEGRPSYSISKNEDDLFWFIEYL